MCGYGTHPQGGARNSRTPTCTASRPTAGAAPPDEQKDIDRYPHCLDNGRIAYTRWEYQERHFWDVHSIWTVRPDGTMSDALFKQHLGDPMSLRHARSVPGTGKLVAIASGHHTFAYGPVVLVDPEAGMNSDAAIRLVTPGSEPQEAHSPVWRGRRHGVPGLRRRSADPGGFYQTPFALSDKCFLVSYCLCLPGHDKLGRRGLQRLRDLPDRLLWEQGVAVPRLALVERLPDPRAQATAAARASGHDGPRHEPRTCLLPDVYEGMAGVARGKVKYLRIAQELPWPLDAKAGSRAYAWVPMWNPSPGLTRWSSVRVIGTVPVEEDGSAHFQVPTADNASVYFQALDENFMELRRMRSSVSFQPGEVRGCSGCHETRASVAKSKRLGACRWRLADLRASRSLRPGAPPRRWIMKPKSSRFSTGTAYAATTSARPRAGWTSPPGRSAARKTPTCSPTIAASTVRT